MTQVSSISDLYWGGAKVDIQSDATFKRGGVVNIERIVGRKVFRAQKMMSGEITGTTVLQRGQKFSDIFPGDEAEIQLHTDTGQIFVAETGFITEDPDVTFGDNHGIKFTIKSDAFIEQAE